MLNANSYANSNFTMVSTMKRFSLSCETLTISSWTNAFLHPSSSSSSSNSIHRNPFIQTTTIPWASPNDGSSLLSMSFQPVYDELCNTVVTSLGLRRTYFTDPV